YSTMQPNHTDFFTSRRRHTSFSRDWSSDVCSSDLIETAVNGQWMDGCVVIGGCDKNMPGGMIAMLRTNVPSIYVYGGTIKPGNWKGKDLTIVSAFEAVGKLPAARWSRETSTASRANPVRPSD